MAQVGWHQYTLDFGCPTTHASPAEELFSVMNSPSDHSSWSFQPIPIMLSPVTGNSTPQEPPPPQRYPFGRPWVRRGLGNRREVRAGVSCTYSKVFEAVSRAECPRGPVLSRWRRRGSEIHLLIVSKPVRWESLVSVDSHTPRNIPGQPKVCRALAINVARCSCLERRDLRLTWRRVEIWVSKRALDMGNAV